MKKKKEKRRKERRKKSFDREMKAPWLVLILMELPDVVLGVSLCHRNDSDFGVRGQSSGEIFVRRRRSLVFPKGSAIVVSSYEIYRFKVGTLKLSQCVDLN